MGFDFQFDQTAAGRVLKLCSIVDELTRQALVMLVARNIDADQWSACLRALSPSWRTRHLMMDNGPEMTAHARQDSPYHPDDMRARDKAQVRLEWSANPSASRS